jgi:hypothetical protein
VGSESFDKLRFVMINFLERQFTLLSLWGHLVLTPYSNSEHSRRRRACCSYQYKSMCLEWYPIKFPHVTPNLLAGGTEHQHIHILLLITYTMILRQNKYKEKSMSCPNWKQRRQLLTCTIRHPLELEETWKNLEDPITIEFLFPIKPFGTNDW